jgi:hypothetical protein
LGISAISAAVWFELIERLSNKFRLASEIFLYTSCFFLGIQLAEFQLQIPPPNAPSFLAADLGGWFFACSFFYGVYSRFRHSQSDETDKAQLIRYLSYVVILAVTFSFGLSAYENWTQPTVPNMIPFDFAFTGLIITSIFGMVWSSFLFRRIERKWPKQFLVPPPPPPSGVA